MNGILLGIETASLSVAAIMLIVLGVCVLASGIFVAVARILLIVRYRKYNAVQLEAGDISSADAARAFLDANGLQNVQIKKAGFFRALLWGNSYSARTKTIYLRSNIYDKTTITAHGVALQKVTIAMHDAQGDKKIATRNWLQIFILFTPIFFIPIMLVGVIVDLVAFNGLGVGTITSTAISFAIVLIGFICTILNLKIEVKANNETIDMLKNSNLMTAEELEVLQKVYQTYKLAYIAEFLTSLFDLLRLFVKLLSRSSNLIKK